MIHNSTRLELSQSELSGLLSPLAFSHMGVAPLDEALSLQFYKNWLSEGLHGSMEYLQRHVPQKENPEILLANAQSAFVFAFPYAPHPESEGYPFEASRVSLYARGKDYHLWIRERLKKGIEILREKFPDAGFACFTDSSPVLERDLAYRAGLGWFGKNACLIHPQKGSLFFIGEIYSTLKIADKTTPVHDFCGTCTRCLDACPTQAFIEPRKLDATKCISYWTIESKEVPPSPLRENIGDWLFGCDICQTVCPWNQKAFKNEKSILDERSLNFYDDSARRKKLIAELSKVLNTSNRELRTWLGQTALSRSAGTKLKKNALVVAGNLGLTELRVDIENYKTHEDLSELALWALNKLESRAD
ncbi:MAG: tRNA epoxyqueuosine(34) reductase QueG [Pseudobdellovibrionaceae bacterium]